MKDLGQLLAENDPVALEPGLSEIDAQAMRRTILAESRRRPLVSTSIAVMSWPSPLALAAALAACLVLGVSLGLRLSDGIFPVVSPRAVAPAAPDVRRQLQMTSPGGTRIIWTFHENLEL